MCGQSFRLQSQQGSIQPAGGATALGGFAGGVYSGGLENEASSMMKV